MTPVPSEEIMVKLIDNLDLLVIYVNDMYSGNMVPNIEIIKALAPFRPLLFAYCTGIGTYIKPATSRSSSQITTTTIVYGRPKDYENGEGDETDE
jgi:hypothetical protein